MYLTQLAEVARRTGMPVKEIDGWKTRGHGPMQKPETITCHHTAGKGDDDWDEWNDDYPSLRVVRDGRPGLPGPLAHYGIGRNTGTIYVFAAGLCYHAGVSRDDSYENPRAIGIEWENDGLGEPIGVKARLSYALLCRELRKEFNVRLDHVLGHKETCKPPGRKTDPRFNMNEFRADVLQADLPPVEIPPAIIVKKEFDMAIKYESFDGKIAFLVGADLYRERVYDPRKLHLLHEAGQLIDGGRKTAEEIALFPERPNLKMLLDQSANEVKSAVAQASKNGGTPEEIANLTMSILTSRLAKS